MRPNLFILVLILLSLSVVATPAGFLQSASPPLLSAGQAVIDPSTGTVTTGKEFVVSVMIYPSIPHLQPGQAKMNNYELVLFYDPNYLTLVTAENVVPGLIVDKNLPSSGYLLLSASQPFGAYFYNQPTIIAKIVFVAKTTGLSEIALDQVDIVNSYGAGGTAEQLITSTAPAKITVVESGSCPPSCKGKECGTDGCGGECGQCEVGENCVEGQCLCVPQCTGRECGNDGCAGSCGICVEELSCKEDEKSSVCVARTEIELSELVKSKQDEPQLLTEKKLRAGLRFSKTTRIGAGGTLIVIALLLSYFLWHRKKTTL